MNPTSEARLRRCLAELDTITAALDAQQELDQSSTKTVRKLAQRTASVARQLRRLAGPPEALAVDDKQLQMLWQQARQALSALEREPGNSELSETEIAVLKAGGLDPQARDHQQDNPLAQTVAEYAALREYSLSVTAAADYLHVHPSRVRQRLKARSLYGFQDNGHWLLPRFQFHANKTLPNLAKVLARLDPQAHPVAVMRWFTRPDAELVLPNGASASPREWLLTGHPVEPLAELAELV